MRRATDGGDSSHDHAAATYNDQRGSVGSGLRLDPRDLDWIRQRYARHMADGPGPGPRSRSTSYYGWVPDELEAIYRQGTAVAIPEAASGARRSCRREPGAPACCCAVPRLMWQGKVFEPGQTSAVNRFFGMRVVRGQVYQGPSWLDGQPSLVLDYSQTSRVYANNRDEIRQVAPGLFLGPHVRPDDRSAGARDVLRTRSRGLEKPAQDAPRFPRRALAAVVRLRVSSWAGSRSRKADWGTRFDLATVRESSRCP